MKAEIQKVSAEGSCEARTENGLLIVFHLPAGRELRIADILEFGDLMVEGDVDVENVSRGYRFVVRLERNNTHDLRLPGGHGTSRFPSKARLGGA